MDRAPACVGAAELVACFQLGCGCAVLGWWVRHGLRGALAVFAAVVALEGGAAGGDYVVFVDTMDEVAEAGFEFGDAHLCGLEVYVEEGAEVPGFVAENAAFLLEARVERRGGEGSLDRDLDVAEAGLLDEVPYFFEGLGAGGVEAENEAAVDTHAAVLDFSNGFEVLVDPTRFPVRSLFEAVHGGEGGAFESDEDFGAACVVKQIQEFVVVGDGEVGLGEPVNLLLGDGAKELFGVGFVDEGVVVGELNEGALPDALDRVNLVDDAGDRFGFIGGGDAHGGGAEFAAEGAAALSLDGEAVVAIDVEKIEARHGGVGEVEVVGACIVDRL